MSEQVFEVLGRPSEPAWSDGGDLFIPPGAPRTLIDAFRATAAEHGDRGILHVRADGSTELQRYADLMIAARHVLSGLRACGLAPRDRVILQLDDLRDHFAALWGCVLGGFVPLTIARPPTEDRANAIVKKLVGAWQLLDRPLVVTQDGTQGQLAGILRGDDAGAAIATIESLRSAPIASTLYDGTPDEVLFLQLTSGSTGVAKCIQETHRSVIAHVHGVARFNGYRESDVTLNWLSMDHVAPTLMCHLKDLYLGCLQIHTRPEVILGDPLAWLDLIEAHRVTHTWSPNFGYKLVCDRLAIAPVGPRDLSSVKFFFNGGEQVTAPVMREFCERIAKFGSHARTVQPAFGMAETATAVVYQNHFDVERSIYRVAKSSLGGALRRAADGDASAVTFVDLGPPIPGVQLRIVDTGNRVVTEGVIGRAQIKGAVVTPGYYRNDEANRAAFVGDGWFDSGDLGFLTEGRLCITGRAKEMIISRGTHYYCSEIEDVVTDVGGVEPTFVAACAIADPTIGSDGLAIFFVPRSPEAGDLLAIIRAIRAAVAVKLGTVPSVVIPLARDAFPKTTSGKIQRAQLKQQLEAGRYEAVIRATEQAIVERAGDGDAGRAPRSAPSREGAGEDHAGAAASAQHGITQPELEALLTEAWKQALSIPRVGLHDNFFELGGHSLAMLEVLGKLQAIVTRPISSVEMFRYPTVSSLAAFLSGGPRPVALESPDRIPPGSHVEDVAIVGVAGRFPKAKTLAEFWRNLVDGVACISSFTDEEMAAAGVEPELLRSPGYVKSAPVLDEVEMFAAPFFGYAPREAEVMDPQQRIFLELAWEALEDAGYAPGTFAGPIGVFGGITFNSYGYFLRRTPGLHMEFISDLVGMDKDFLTTRVSYKLDLKGPSVNVQTACSTSLVAVHLACRSLLAGDAEMALAGAVSVRVPHRAGHLYQEGGIFSVDGLCRAFDARASGMVFGNGGGVIVLKRLARAIRDNDTIHAVIKGSAINNDGSWKAGFTAPSVEGQVKVLRAAMASGAVAPETVSYLEAHGTGTSLGDPIELAALCEAFDHGARRSARCALGSVKTNIGHLDVAAGIAGLIKTVLMLRHRQLVPSLHFEEAHPALGLAESPFHVTTKLSPWPAGATPRRAGVSAFGFGGTNAHVVLEEAPSRDAPVRSSTAELLVLSARTATALAHARVELAEHLRRHPGLALSDVAYTLQVGRRAFDHRCMLVCRDTADAAEALGDLESDRVVTAVSTAERLDPAPTARDDVPRQVLLDILGRRYLANLPVDWAALHSGGGPGRIPLPTYPFERQRYWIDLRSSASQRPTRIGKREDLGAWTYVPSWRRAPQAGRPASDGADAGLRWLILCDESGAGLHLAQDLTRSGHRAVTVNAGDGFARIGDHAYAIDPRNRADYTALLESLGAEVPDHVVHLWSLPEAAASPVSETMSRGSRSLVYLAQAMAQRDWTHPIRVTVAGSEAFEVVGDEPIAPAKLTVVAPVIGISQEHRNLTCRYVDVEPRAQRTMDAALLSEWIRAEALDPSTDPVIAVRGRHRWVQGYEPFPVRDSSLSPSRLRRGGVYLITGGVGSIGLVVAERLASRYQAKLVLTSRGRRSDERLPGAPGRPEPEDPAVTQRLRALEELGAEVMVVAADVADAGQMREVLLQIAERFGALHGVIHAAGLLKGDAFPTIARCTPAQWEAQLRPKVAGTLVLAEILPEGLDFCVVFSSVASALGGLGLCAYAAANLFMDGFVQDRNRRARSGSTPWLSVNWDYWRTTAGPRNEALGSTLFHATGAARAELGMTPDEGFEIFERVLSLPPAAVPQILVATGDLEARIARWVRRTLPPRAGDTARPPAESMHRTADPGSPVAPHVAPRDDTEALIAQLWQELLGIARIGVDDDFFALGGDSLHAVRFGARLKDALGCAISIHELFKAPTVARLADRLRQRRGEPPRPARRASDDHPATASRATIQADQFAVGLSATSDDKKRHMKQFYDAITDQLDASEIGASSVFLNLGYVADDGPRYSPIRVPDHLINVSSVRLVLEVIGDCAMGPDCEVLDVGCGRGGTISQIQECFEVKAITGVDLSPGAIAFCRERHRRPDTRFVEGDAEALPCPDESFDVVLNVESSHSYPDLPAFYREAYRVLRPGGHLLYADLFPAAAVSTCLDNLRLCGFTVLRDQDITRNVVLSCDRVARTRLHAFGAANDPTVMANFLGAPGSKIYDDLAGGHSTYRIFKLQRPRVSPPRARSRPSVAFLFPGQGAQDVHMGLGLYRTEPRFRREVDRCAELLVPHLGLDVRDVVFPPGEPDAAAAARLQNTALAQPALFVIEYALAQLMMSRGVVPGALVGHSLGEYVAACLAGVFSLEDAAMLVAARGRIMQSMAPGAMLSIARSEADVRPLLSDETAVAAINTSSSTVVAGPFAAIDALAHRLDQLEFPHVRLRTSHAFHSSMMDPAMPELARQVARCQLAPPRMRLASNLTGAWITPDQATDPEYWTCHLRATVRFADALATVLEPPTEVLLELGPGRVLQSFVRAHPAYRPEHRIVSILGDPRRDDVTRIAPLIEELGSRAAASTGRPRAQGTNLLVELQRGHAAEHPLFLVHPIGGTVFHYRPLAHHLGLRPPIYGLRASGLEPGEVIDGNVESMAARYIEAIRARQPDGPYLLGGWSFGGMVAYEMAVQLQRAGEEISCVFMIDSPGPGHLPAELASAPNTDDIDRLAPAMYRSVLLPRADERAMLAAVLPDDRAFLPVFCRSLGAMARYQPSRYFGRVVVLRATEHDPGSPLRPEQAWAPLVTGELEVVDVPGSHFTMMIAPHVKTLATQLHRALVRVSRSRDDVR
jgi:acyl transferase domain-containing protein/acyl-CoA synthetase (AMP-forming)/AMP-acid ligase II/thioesterase domain-containing protein/SAM-dependent methyltransferase/acyl carrier protein